MTPLIFSESDKGIFETELVSTGDAVLQMECADSGLLTVMARVDASLDYVRIASQEVAASSLTVLSLPAGLSVKLVVTTSNVINAAVL